MSRAININRQGEEIDLKVCRYRIYILGGWGVSLSKFSISFKHKETNDITKSERAFWQVQAYAFRKRAKRIFIIDVHEEGKYEIIFRNPETVTVMESNLRIGSFFSNPISKDDLEVLITEKLGITFGLMIYELK